MAMQRAQGWLELNLPLEANEELNEVQPQLRAITPGAIRFAKAKGRCGVRCE